MTTYVDSSALLKSYFTEPDSSVAERLLSGDSVLVTSRVTLVEVRRNLARALRGTELREAKEQFITDLESMALIAVDETVCRAAEEIGEQSAYEDETETARRLRRGDESMGDPNERDIAGAVDSREVSEQVRSRDK